MELTILMPCLDEAAASSEALAPLRVSGTVPATRRMTVGAAPAGMRTLVLVAARPGVLLAQEGH